MILDERNTFQTHHATETSTKLHVENCVEPL